MINKSYHVLDYSVTPMYASCCHLRVAGETDLSENLTQTCKQCDVTSARFLLCKRRQLYFPCYSAELF